MKIDSLKIKNIKSFKDEVEISFDEKLNVLIGPNGGGKSNLLDIITIALRKFFILNYRIDEGSDNSGPFKNVTRYDPFPQVDRFLEEFIGDTSPSFLEVTFKVTTGDIQNIKAIKKYKNELEERLKTFRNKPINDFSFCDSWDLRKLKVGNRINYKVTDNSLENPASNTTEEIYLKYLNHIELFIILNEKLNNLNLSPIYLYFSPNRSIDPDSTRSNLSGENYYELLAGYLRSTSRDNMSLLKIATNYFASKRRGFEGHKKEGYENRWESNNEVKLVTKYLDKLRYSWDLNLVEERSNTYEVNLKSEGKIFTINQASSGEKEIINFLFGIFAFNIGYGTIIIDEPELHLHPKWQAVITDLFMELSEPHETDSQFILSTHSPVFISQKTLSKTIRVYKDADGRSKVIYLKEDNLGSLKDLLHIVNTHNNERIFFADKVVLVEGIHDRVIYEKLLQHYLGESTEVIEVVEVRGKHNFEKYRSFLDKFKIKNFILCDRDYLVQVGNEQTKKLFIDDKIKIDDLLRDSKSKDRKTLTDALDQTIINKNYKNLIRIWQYIKSRNRRLKDGLSNKENSQLNKNISELKENGVLILSYGELEDYLPSGFKTLEKALDLVKESEFKRWIDNLGKDTKKDLDGIVKLIKR